MLQSGVLLALFLRFGLLALVTAVTVTNLAIMYPTARFADSWLSNGSTILVLSVPAIAVYGGLMATRTSAGPITQTDHG